MMSDTGLLASAVHPVEGAIRNPANPNHFMVLKPIPSEVEIATGEAVLALTQDAFWLIELGDFAYPPRIYVPLSDVLADLSRTDKVTHCPLKGDAGYLAFRGEEVGWTYDTLDFARVLKGFASFRGKGVRARITCGS